MFFRQLFDQKSCTYTYLIASKAAREGIIIDPVKEQMPLYQQLLMDFSLNLLAVIDTHVHADHITAASLLREFSQCEIAMGEKSPAECISMKLADQESFGFADINLRALYTPGHTIDSYSFLLENQSGKQCVFTGDTLLIRGTGRTDFQNGSAADQYDSLFDVLLKLPDETLVYPAHDYKGMTVSTISEEKRFNPRLQVDSKQAYIELMNSLQLPKPKMMDIAVPANLLCGNSSKK